MRAAPTLVLSYVLAAAGLLAGGACGTSVLPTDDGADWAEPGILLGDWVAAKNEHRSQANPSIVVAVQDTFTLSVTADGRYEATLIITGAVERGWVRVEPPTVTFRPTEPPGTEDPASLLVRADTVILTGDSEFDFGGGVEPSTLVLELVPG